MAGKSKTKTCDDYGRARSTPIPKQTGGVAARPIPFVAASLVILLASMA